MISADGQESGHASRGKRDFTSMSNVLEPFDSGSPLTEATGNASPKSHYLGRAHRDGGAAHFDGRREQSGTSVDPTPTASINGYASSASNASERGVEAGRCW